MGEKWEESLLFLTPQDYRGGEKNEEGYFLFVFFGSCFFSFKI
jgi:hypothetical protein